MEETNEDRLDPAGHDSTESAGAGSDPTGLGMAWAAAILVVAFAVRFGVAEQLSRTVLYQFPQLDAMEFLRWASSIASGEMGLPEYPTHGPGYPYFLGALFALFDGSLQAARIVQCVLGAFTCLLTAQIAVRVWNRVAGIGAGMLLALHGPLAMAETALWEDGLFLFLLTASLWAFVVLEKSSPSLREETLRAGLCGLLLGGAILVRPTPLVILPALVLLLVIERRRRALPSVAALTLTALLVVVPAIVAVSQAAGTFLLLRGFGAINLYIGNDPAGGGAQNARLGGDWDRLESAPFRDGVTEKGDLEGYYTDRTIERALDDPAAFVGVVASKIVWMTQAEELRDNHSYLFFRRSSSILRFSSGFGVLFACGVLGFWFAIRRRRVPWPVLAYLLLMAATAVATLIGMRYRMPIVPPLSVFGGIGIAGLAAAVSEKQWRTATILAVVAATIFAATHVRRHEPTRNFAEELALSASSLEKEGRLDEAEALFRETIEENPDSALGWDGLGRVHLRRGEAREAREALEEATRRDPDFRRAHYHLAVALEELGDGGAAIDSLRRAVAIGPRYLQAQSRLAPRLFGRGALDEAEESWNWVLAVAPHDASAQIGLRMIEAVRAAERGDVPAALAGLQGVLVEQPRNDAAAQLLLHYAERIGQRADAAGWLQKNLRR